MKLSLIDHTFRHSCVLCGDASASQRICQRCMSVLPWNLIICERCGQPVISVLPANVSCAACQRRSPVYEKARSPLHYAFPVDAALKALKFHRQLVYAPAFASLLLPVLNAEFPDCDALVPVPLYRWRHIKRGFNQAFEICRELVNQTGLPVIENAYRTRSTKTQSGLTSAMRRKNLRGAFAIRGKLRARRPLVIDDVITTGATCEQLAVALLEAGADKVGVLTVARSSRLI